MSPEGAKQYQLLLEGNSKEILQALTRDDSARARGHQVASKAGDGDAAEPGVGGDHCLEHRGPQSLLDAFGETLELQGGGRGPAGPRAAEAEAAIPRNPFDRALRGPGGQICGGKGEIKGSVSSVSVPPKPLYSSSPDPVSWALIPPILV